MLPRPLTIIGITPKSYGYFHFNNRPGDGVEFLKNTERIRDAGSAMDKVMLPGTSYNDSWLLAMEAMRESEGAAHGVSPNYRRYRLLQIVHVYKRRYFDRTLTDAEVIRLRARMRCPNASPTESPIPFCSAFFGWSPPGRAKLLSRGRAD